MSNRLLENFAALIQEAVRREIVEPAMVERGAGWLEEFRREQPALYALIKGFFTAPPAAVLERLAALCPALDAYRQHPIAQQLVGRLQARIGIAR